MSSSREVRLLADDFLGVPVWVIIDGNAGDPFAIARFPDLDGVPLFSNSEESDAVQLDAEQSDAEQSDAEQPNAEQSDAEQSDVEQSDAEQSDAEQSDAEQSDAEQSDAEQSDAEQSDAEEYDEVTDSSEWTGSNESVSEDSGYSSMYSEEDDDHIPPEFPPHPPQQHIAPPEGDLPDRPQFVVCLGRISPFGLWDLQESFAEDSDSSASVPSSSQKRSREDSDGDQPSAKRPRESCEESPGEEQSFPDSTPSTSGLKSRCDVIDLTVKRPRWDDGSNSD
ncbi:lisH domain-containing protein C1711.05-like [Melanotaenia boesemani]|uniref:lisH domain-containing protein C1711.05-like n=1 Tax=Melanotaenia boesemani TaxID=1250792 RepID=UPI001C04CD99|nr:lisH domain-containing protein C1711.05-like [Melanotaenia boesemani]XP_041852985.1 lisH domain-containing protein C1711.05-like [Melanotaenia boesemani]